MRVKAEIVLHEGLEVIPVLPHIGDHLRTVDEVVVGVAKQLVPQGPEQAVAVPGDLLEGEPECPQLRVEAAEVVPVPRLAALRSHGRPLLLVSPVRRADLPLNSLLGHSSSL